MSIDLHTHTTASDGTCSPTELVKLASEVGLEAIAVTDHDTLSGLDEAQAAGQLFGVEVIPGCELSLELEEGIGWLHMVALWVPQDAKSLNDAFEWVIERRRNRNHEIVEQLRKQGISITYEAVAARAEGTVGRPHFAQELVSLGVASDVKEAFRVWIGDYGRAYVPKRKLKPKQALDILNEIGATSILAHPFALNMKPQDVDELLGKLKAMGLDGIEVYYSEHSDVEVKRYKELAEKHDLLLSGGSDFHGTNKPHIALGKGRGKLDVPSELLEKMKARRREQGLSV